MALVPLKELIQRRFANPNGAKLQRRQKPQVDEPIYERRVRMEQLTDFFYGVEMGCRRINILIILKIATCINICYEI